MPDDDLTPADRLAAELRRHREQAGVSGAELARRITDAAPPGVKYSQPTVNRYERGVGAPPRPHVVELIAQALNLPAEDRVALVSLAQDVADRRSDVTPIRVVLQHGVESVQRRIRLRERTVEHLRVFHPSIVPGLLQTEGYARMVFAAHGLNGAALDRLVAERLRRASESATRTCTILLTEGTLMQGVPDGAVMAEQCRHIATTAVEHQHWRVGVVPRVITGRPANVTHNGFDAYERSGRSGVSHEVFIGTTAGNALVTDKATVAEHLRRFAELEALALFGDDARQVLERIAEDYRKG